MSRNSVNNRRDEQGLPPIEELSSEELVQLLKEKYAMSGGPFASEAIHDIWVECEKELLHRIKCWEYKDKIIEGLGMNWDELEDAYAREQAAALDQHEADSR